MNRTLEKLLRNLNDIKDPVTKGTLRIGASSSLYDGARNYFEDHKAAVDFMKTLGDFYRDKCGKSREGYEIRQSFKEVDTSDSIQDLSTRAMFKAMANSVLDSLRNSDENHRAVYRFFTKFEKAYWREAVTSGAMEAVKYSELDSWEKLKILNFYNKAKKADPKMTKWDFVKTHKLSSTYVLNRILRDFEDNDGKVSTSAKVLKFKYNEQEDSSAPQLEFVPLFDMLNKKSVQAVMDLIP